MSVLCLSVRMHLFYEPEIITFMTLAKIMSYPINMLYAFFQILSFLTCCEE